MKKTWEEPKIYVEKFTPNEYIAACGDKNTQYLFTCDAGGGKEGFVYLETNGKSGFQDGLGGDQFLSAYYACGKTHLADTEDEFLEGYYVTLEDFSKTVTPVIVWRGPRNDNTHCTTNLDKNSWTTAKS